MELFDRSRTTGDLSVCGMLGVQVVVFFPLLVAFGVLVWRFHLVGLQNDK